MAFTHSTKDIINRIADTTVLSKGQAEIAIKALVAIITDAALQREDVKIRHLGTFTTVDCKAKVGRNIQTGDLVPIPARVKLAFRPTKALKDI